MMTRAELVLLMLIINCFALYGFAIFFAHLVRSAIIAAQLFGLGP